CPFSISKFHQRFSRRTKKDYSDNFRTHYIFKFNDLLKKNEYIKEVSRKYKDKEKALKYIEGRKKYYKKYFKEEKPPLPVIYHTDNYYRNKKEEKKGKPLIYLHDIKLKGYKINKELIIK
ncbi:MAG: hypothetical protein ACOCP8_09590, partial [archaeon]